MPSSTQPSSRRRWLILALIGVAQLMVVLDATIVNIALPSAQEALGFSDESRQWVVTAYALSFGSLLLFGGRLGDLFGRKRVFIIGLAGFAAASALGGFAASFAVLVVARALQGAFAALLAPAALSLLTTTFTIPEERNRAFGVFGVIAGSGAAVGLILGGALTEYLDWRWSDVRQPDPRHPRRDRPRCGCSATERRRAERPRIDLPGALTASAGLFALVYGFSNAETQGWGAPLTIAGLAAGVALLAAFVAVERRVGQPAAAAARRRRPRPRRRLPRHRDRRRRDVRRLPVPHLLHAADPGLLAAGHRPRVPADDGVIMPTGAIGQTRLLPRFGPRPLVTARHAARRGRDADAHGRERRLELRARRPAGPAGDRPRPGPGLRARRWTRPRVGVERRRRGRRLGAWSTPASRSAARSAPRC